MLGYGPIMKDAQPFDLQNVLYVQKGNYPGHFETIKDALDSITDSSSSNPYTIMVGPGVYTEDNSGGALSLPEGVTLKAVGHGTPIVQPTTAANDLFLLENQSCRIQGFTLQNVTGAKAIKITTGPAPAVLDFLTILNCQIPISVESTSADVQAVLRNIRLISGSTTTKLLNVTSSSGNDAIVRIYSAILTDDNGTAFQDAIYLSGSGTRIDPNTVLIRSTVDVGNGIQLVDGALIVVTAGLEIKGFDKGIYIPNTGAAPTLNIMSLSLGNDFKDLDIVHPSTAGYIICSHAELDKISNAADTTLTLSYVDPSTGDYNNTRILATRGLATDLELLASFSGTHQLISFDPHALVVTGTTAGTIIQLPDATTLRVGHQFWIINKSTQQITIQQYGAVSPAIMNPGGSARLVVIDNTTAAGDWNRTFSSASSFSGTAPILASYGASAGVGRYLEIWDSLASDTSPFLVPVSSILVALTVGAEASSTGTVAIFKTSDLVNPITSISLSASQENTILNLNVPLSAGDKLAIRVTSGSIQKPRFAMYVSASS